MKLERDWVRQLIAKEYASGECDPPLTPISRWSDDELEEEFFLSGLFAHHFQGHDEDEFEGFC